MTNNRNGKDTVKKHNRKEEQIVKKNLKIIANKKQWTQEIENIKIIEYFELLWKIYDLLCSTIIKGPFKKPLQNWIVSVMTLNQARVEGRLDGGVYDRIFRPTLVLCNTLPKGSFIRARVQGVLWTPW